MENKKNAIKRSKSLDFKILEDTSSEFVKKSKYFEQYQINNNAIKKLELAIKNHPMNKQNIMSKDLKTN